MKQVLVLFVVAVLMGLCWQAHTAPIDLRPRIDGSSVYSNSDSLEFTDVGSASYAGYSDTIFITGCNLISADFILTRNGKTTANCAIQLQGSKDKVRFVNLDSNGASTTITAASTTTATTLTFPYAPIYPYYRLYVDNDTLFSAMVKWMVGGKVNAK